MAEPMMTPEPVEPEPQMEQQEEQQAGESVQVFPNAPVPRTVQFAPVGSSGASNQKNPLDLIMDVQVQITVELGRATLQVRDVLEFGPGSVVELQKLAGEPVEVLVNNKLFGRGEVVVIDENFGVRVTEIVSPDDRISSLK